MRRLLTMPMPPPQDTVARAMRHPNVRLHFAAPMSDAALAVDGIRLRTPIGWHAADFLILGTGFAVDLSLRPELSAIAGNIATWADRYTPPVGEADTDIAQYPYLGQHFELSEKHPGTMPALRNIHVFNSASTVSTGIIGSGVNGMPWGVPRLLAGLSHDLYAAEVDSIFADFTSYQQPDAWETVRARTA